MKEMATSEGLRRILRIGGDPPADQPFVDDADRAEDAEGSPNIAPRPGTQEAPRPWQPGEPGGVWEEIRAGDEDDIRMCIAELGEVPATFELLAQRTDTFDGDEQKVRQWWDEEKEQLPRPEWADIEDDILVEFGVDAGALVSGHSVEVCRTRLRYLLRARRPRLLEVKDVVIEAVDGVFRVATDGGLPERLRSLRG
jgi:hypothetical protein